MDLGLTPLEGYGVLVVARDEGVDRRAQLGHRGEAGTLKRAAAEDREPDLDLVEPGSVGRGEVEVEPLVSEEPALHERRLVHGQVVEDDVHVQLGGHLRLTLFKKATKSALVWRARMSLMTLPVAISSAANRSQVPFRS